MARRDSAPGGLVLRGRRDQCAALDGLLEGARAGQSGLLVLRGDPGIGKTALLEYAIGSSSSSPMRVLRAGGVEAEMELPFAALHQLCAPLLDRLDGLPGPQRDALAKTFGLSVGAAPDRFFVGLAVLGLLSEAAEARPLLCVIDDAQWLDRASAQALAFVARRMLAEPVVILVATREPRDLLAGLPELVLEGLGDADARALLASVIPGRLDERVADELLAETRGNPLALLELPRGLSTTQLAGGFGLPAALSLSGRIEESFQQRLEALPEDTQRLLLVAAAEPTGDPGLLWHAIERLGITAAALEPAESAGLIEIDGRVRFRHPLVRSAIYRAATADQRRRVHRALAEATDVRVDPDRRAWHLAEAAARPDEDVAAELQRAAGRAQARGGLAAAAAFLERAAMLTAEPQRHRERALAAAQAKYEAGALDDALALLSTTETGAAEDLRGRVALLRAQIVFASRRGSDAPPLLLRAARELESVDASLARATYLEAFSAALFAGRLAHGGGVVEIAEAVRAGSPSPQPARPSDRLMHGLTTRFTKGYSAGAPLLKQALSAFRRDAVLPPEEARWLWFACWAAADLWDDETWDLLSARQLELVRAAGALTALPFALTARSAVHLVRGDVHAAASQVDEIQTVSEATGIATPPYGPLWLAGLRGDEAELSRLTETAVGEAIARGEGFAVADAELVRAMLYNGLGRYEATLSVFGPDGERSYDINTPPRAVAEVIEAAVRCEERQLARRLLDGLAEMAQASGTDWVVGVEARSRALVSEGDSADALYAEAIERLAHTRVRLELARAHLLYGEWLRRERRRLDARTQLRTALEMFTAMGVEAFTARAEGELRATGARVGARTVATRAPLTTQETQVARLARDGLSNTEIGARLFISQHTVAYHLRKVFSKLGITSRSHLDRVLCQRAAVRRTL
ncbi:MAG TPA: AAA family ATPase [Solirubrobacteraceae bacterium]|jgi:DNA-binding CsgD family transcriptional regulator|nr:AAA family ATPase [Solirubrobacteraceae bacterium]